MPLPFTILALTQLVARCPAQSLGSVSNEQRTRGGRRPPQNRHRSVGHIWRHDKLGPMGSTSKLCAVALAEVDSSWQEFDILEGKNGLASSILWQWISYAMCGLADMLSERLLWRTWRPRTAQLPATAMAQTGKSPAKAQGPPIQHKRNRVRTRT